MKLLDNTLIQALIMALILTAPLLLAGSGTGAGQLPSKLEKPAADRISAEALHQLKAEHHKTRGFRDGAWSATPPEGGVLRQDIYRNSVILQAGGSHTVLPPHSILHLPRSLRQMSATRPIGDYLPWPEFYARNRSAVLTHSVTLEQALGKTPIGQDVSRQLRKINRIVVALYQNNPVSVLPASRENAQPSPNPKP